MIDSHSKRYVRYMMVSVGAWFLVLSIWLNTPPSWSQNLQTIIGIATHVIFAAAVILWFLSVYHGCKAKGYSANMALIGLTGFPIAPIVTHFLDDLRASRVEKEQFRACPHCGEQYRPSDYREDTDHIFCSRCKRELPLPSVMDNTYEQTPSGDRLKAPPEG